MILKINEEKIVKPPRCLAYVPGAQNVQAARPNIPKRESQL